MSQKNNYADLTDTQSEAMFCDSRFYTKMKTHRTVQLFPIVMLILIFSISCSSKSTMAPKGDSILGNITIALNLSVNDTLSYEVITSKESNNGRGFVTEAQEKSIMNIILTDTLDNRNRIFKTELNYIPSDSNPEEDNEEYQYFMSAIMDMTNALLGNSRIVTNHQGKYLKSINYQNNTEVADSLSTLLLPIYKSMPVSEDLRQQLIQYLNASVESLKAAPETDEMNDTTTNDIFNLYGAELKLDSPRITNSAMPIRLSMGEPVECTITTIAELSDQNIITVSRRYTFNRQRISELVRKLFGRNINVDYSIKDDMEFYLNNGILISKNNIETVTYNGGIKTVRYLTNMKLR